ncbi:MAG: hypothetical protein QXQ53_09235, partial [Candidatus Methanosuratincola sp.]
MAFQSVEKRVEEFPEADGIVRDPAKVGNAIHQNSTGTDFLCYRFHQPAGLFQFIPKQLGGSAD